jgi:parallel beta-helix repeat protein
MKPYQTKPGFLYIPVKRGDGVISPRHQPQVRMFNGMCSGYIDPVHWKIPPALSTFSQGETLWLEIPKSTQSLSFANDACLQSFRDRSDKNFRLSNLMIDPAKLSQLTNNKNLLFDFYSQKKPIPVQRFNYLPVEAISESSRIDINRKPIFDVGLIQAGSFFIGPGANNHYPTFGGAGGGFAALGNLTADLTFFLKGIVTETTQSNAAISLNNHTLASRPATFGFNFDPLTHIISNVAGSLFLPTPDGPGTILFTNLSITSISPFLDSFIHTVTLADDFITEISYCFLNGNSAMAALCKYAIWLQSTNSNLIRRNLIYNTSDSGIRIEEETIIQNNTIISCPTGISLNSQLGKIRNNYVADSSIACITNKDQADGFRNATSDATGQGLWHAELGNIINIPSATSIYLTPESYGDIIRDGPLAEAGIITGIVSPCIKGRISTAPGSIFPSIGAAELSISPHSDMRYW